MPTSRRAFLQTMGAAIGAAAIAEAADATVPTTLFPQSKEPEVAAPLNTLWYTKPAANWLEALPIGNGRISAMVYGGVEQERLQLNEGTLWSGGPHDYTSPEGLAALPEIRRLVFAGKWHEAQSLVDSKFLGRPASQSPYQTVGSLIINFAGIGQAADYRRDLDLNTATTKCTFTANGVKYTRESFVSVPHQAIIVRITADKPASVSLRVQFESLQKSTTQADGDSGLSLLGIGGDAGGVAGAVRFQASVRASVTGGKVVAAADSLSVANADAVTLKICIATGYVNYKDVSGDPAAKVSAAHAAIDSTSFDKLRKAHIADYQRLFKRVLFELGTSESEKLPTDERVRQYHLGQDPQLAALHFQYGRYLLISASRAGGQPATLQGLWNDSVSPPWGCKYTININTEMNYWPAGPTNLMECYEPLNQLLLELSEAGKSAARGLYGADGWVCHHNTDGWRGTAPVDASYYGMWPMGGAWLCKNLWDQYEYTHDLKALSEHYPIMKGAALFFLDSLVADPTHGWLVTCPSVSPEHGHHSGVSICAGPTMDTQILHDLFDACIHASELLKLDTDLRKRWVKTKAKLAPMHVGSEGQLQEWLEDWDMGAEDIHHRHVSHLYGLYPSDQITKRTTPQLFDGARKSLEIRGDMATGWSLAWKINLWARLEDGDRAHKLLGDLLTPERTAPNLFDLHPPFQIDGNFGAAAGIAEMLVQCKQGEIHLLAALPSAWPAGRVEGLLAKGGFTIDLSWNGGKLAQARITSHAGATCALRLGEKTLTFPTRPGGKYIVGSDLKRE